MAKEIGNTVEIVSESRPGQFSFVEKVEKIVLHLFIGDQVWRFIVKNRQTIDCADIASLGVWDQALQGHVPNEFSPEFGAHSSSSLVEVIKVP